MNKTTGNNNCGTVLSSDGDATVQGLGQAIDSLVNHFNHSLDQIWRLLVDARKSELATIDENFRQLRDSLNKVILDRQQQSQGETPRAMNSKRNTFLQSQQSKESSQKTTPRCISYRSDHARNQSKTNLMAQIKEVDKEYSQLLLQETREEIKRQTQSVRTELDSFLSRLSQQLTEQQARVTPNSKLATQTSKGSLEKNTAARPAWNAKPTVAMRKSLGNLGHAQNQSRVGKTVDPNMSKQEKSGKKRARAQPKTGGVGTAHELTTEMTNSSFRTAPSGIHSRQRSRDPKQSKPFVSTLPPGIHLKADQSFNTSQRATTKKKGSKSSPRKGSKNSAKKSSPRKDREVSGGKKTTTTPIDLTKLACEIAPISQIFMTQPCSSNGKNSSVDRSRQANATSLQGVAGQHSTVSSKKSNNARVGSTRNKKQSNNSQNALISDESANGRNEKRRRSRAERSSQLNEDSSQPITNLILVEEKVDQLGKPTNGFGSVQPFKANVVQKEVTTVPDKITNPNPMSLSQQQSRSTTPRANQRPYSEWTSVATKSGGFHSNYMNTLLSGTSRLSSQGIARTTTPKATSVNQTHQYSNRAKNFSMTTKFTRQHQSTLAQAHKTLQQVRNGGNQKTNFQIAGAKLGTAANRKQPLAQAPKETGVDKQRSSYASQPMQAKDLNLVEKNDSSSDLIAEKYLDQSLVEKELLQDQFGQDQAIHKRNTSSGMPHIKQQDSLMAHVEEGKIEDCLLFPAKEQKQDSVERGSPFCVPDLILDQEETATLSKREDGVTSPNFASCLLQKSMAAASSNLLTNVSSEEERTTEYQTLEETESENRTKAAKSSNAVAMLLPDSRPPSSCMKKKAISDVHLKTRNQSTLHKAAPATSSNSKLNFNHFA